jgi:hypothetical protein
MTTPNRFDVRHLFLGTKWNVFMLLVALLSLWISGSFGWAAYVAASWWALAGWAILFIVFLDTAKTSALRLWRNRKPS